MTKPLPPITYDVAVQLLTDVVAEQGADYIYPKGSNEFIQSCDYVRDDKPSCLIGCALFKHGINIETLDAMDMWGGIFDVYGAMGDELPTITSDGLTAFEMAQNSQDAGKTWGDALKAATR